MPDAQRGHIVQGSNIKLKLLHQATAAHRKGTLSAGLRGLEDGPDVLTQYGTDD